MMGIRDLMKLTVPNSTVVALLALTVASALMEMLTIMSMFVLLATLLRGGILMSYMQPIQPFIDRVSDALGLPALGAAAVLFLIVNIVRVAVQFGRKLTLRTANLEVKFELKHRLFLGSLGLAYERFILRNTAERIHLMTQDTDRAGLAMASTLEIFGAVVNMVGIALLLFLVDPRALLVAGGMGLVVAALMRVPLAMARELGAERGPQGRRMQMAMTEPLRAYRAVVTMDATESLYRRVHRESTGFRGLISKQMRLGEAVFAMVEIATVVVIAGSILSLLAITSDPDEALPIIIIVFAATTRIMPSIRLISKFAGKYQYNLPAVERIGQELEEMEAFHSPYEDRYDRLEEPGLLVHVDGVSFRYEEGPEVLKDLELRVARGEKVAIVGQSGAGKSTLVDLLLSLLSPTAGKVRVAQHGDNHIRISYLPQESIILDGSLLENVTMDFDAEPADRDRVRDLIKTVGLAPEDGGPKDLDAPLGERGARLSGGQRQRLGLARALYRDPELLILDEPTASLDGPSEKRLVTLLESMPIAMVIVTHRDEPLRICDRTFAIEDGGLVEQSPDAESAEDE